MTSTIPLSGHKTWEFSVTLRDKPSKWGSSASFMSLIFWPIRACLTVAEHRKKMVFCRVHIVLRLGYKGRKKNCSEIWRIVCLAANCHKIDSRTARSLYPDDVKTRSYMNECDRGIRCGIENGNVGWGLRVAGRRKRIPDMPLSGLLSE